MTELKLNLGSRDRRVDGFKNMDIDAHPGVDYVGDVSDLSQFADGSVAEILASNILEHFPHTRTAGVLKEWHRVLAPGGKLYVSVPDFARAVELYETGGLENWVENFLMGDQVYETAFHYAIFDESRLYYRLMDAGFKEMFVVTHFGFTAPEDCSNLVSTLDEKPVCLNAIAVKGEHV